MKSKAECLKILQSKGVDAILDERNIMIVRPTDKVPEETLRKYMKTYPYSWGIRGKRTGQENASTSSEEETVDEG